MYTIGITGGVGAGKSEIMKHISKRSDAVVYEADDIARALILPGRSCYAPVIELLGKDIVGDDGYIDKARMADIIFHDSTLLKKVNAIIHPLVKEGVVRLIEKSSQRGLCYFFLEAALLIEGGYKALLDEIWYIHSKKDVRIRRLMQERAYSREKINDIISEQMDEEEFFAACDFTIDNSGDIQKTLLCIDEKLSEKTANEPAFPRSVV